MTDLALADLFRPYLLRGENTDWHAALSVIHVESFETALGAEGMVIRGVARFSGDVEVSFDPLNGVLRAEAANSEGHPRRQPGRSQPWLDITDTRVEFALAVPRAAGAIIASGVAGVPGSNAAFQPVRDVLTALDAIPGDAPPSDYPGTGFSLDLVLAGIVLRPPFLKPARLQPDGLLIPDTSRSGVTFTLPRVKLRLAQGSGANAVLDVSIASLGVAGIDDPGDIAAAELISMDPPYAFIGDGRVVGFGFRSATLDLADGYTPPAVLDQFGFDDSWTGLYLPEIRLFVAPNGMEDFAVDVGVRNLLIGIGQSSGITGDFEASVINQGSGTLALSARFFDGEGRAIGITKLTATTAEVALPTRSRMIIDISGGRAPYVGQATFGGSNHSGIAHDIDLSAAGELSIGVTASDASAPQKTATLTITARRRQDNAVLPAPGAATPLPATLATTSITLDGAPQPAPELLLVRQDAGSVVVSLNPAHPATAWTVAGTPATPGPTVTIPLAPGETKPIRAALSGQTFTAITCYFRFDQPPLSPAPGFAIEPDNSNSSMAVDPGNSAVWTPPGTPFLERYRAVLKRITATSLTLTGSASYEGNDAKAKYNYLLSRRRAEALRQLLADAATHPDAALRLPVFTLATQPADIGAAAPPAAWTGDWQTHADPRNRWWKAEIGGFSPVTLPGTITDGEARRPAAPPPPPAQIPVVDTPPSPPPPPDWFRSISLKVRIVRDQFVAVELSGQVDFETATEQRLRNQGLSNQQIPTFEGLGSQNPADGIVDYRILYQRDPASQTEAVKLYLGADPADKDGLVMTGQLPGQPLKPPSTGRNLLGMTTLFTPLLAETAPDNPADGNVGALVLSAAAIGLPLALAELGFFNIERVVLYGGELDVTVRAGQWQTTLLFDVETAISADIKIGGVTILEIPRTKPLTVRYKAIGLRMGYPAGSAEKFQLRPMFDSSKGYSIDLSGPGAIKVPDPLGQILQVLGARIARTNPLTFEIDLGFAVDLGVVTVERARVRLPVQPLGPPELTAFAASIAVPGVIEGRGVLEINSQPIFEMKGQIDVSLVPLKLRLSAGLGIASIPANQGGPATGVIITLELELPVAIPLAQSGFGIYGFLGLFAMHYARDEDGINSLTPALTWLKDRAQGNPTNITAWKPKVDSWAFGVGALLGTMGSSIIFNVKGVVMLELPGPRLLIVVRANLLAVLPDLKDKNAQGTFLCVIDLDFGRGTLSIGLSIDFSIKPIVEIQIPIEAYFNLKKGSDWHVYLGTFPGNDLQNRPLPGPIHARILEVFDGQGYVMVSGHGIPAFKGLSAVSGVALAVGLEVSIVWGNTSINLYLRATAGFNAVLGFDPFYVGGTLYVRGELHLFILSISASASLTVQIGTRSDGTEVSRIDGEICGEVDLFFFTIKGCVDFHIGENSAIVPLAPDLIKSAVLVGRSPALVVGTGIGRVIDGKIGDARRSATAPAANDVPVVPIDAIPLLTMATTPVDPTLKIFGQPPSGDPGAPGPDGFVAMGDFAYKFDLTSVSLERADGGAAVGAGPTPSTWWTLNDPTAGNITAQLALLNWTPDPTPKAVERSEFLEENVTGRWGSICHDPAPAAAVLWTFEHEATGPSETGWRLDGIAWPDPAGSKRSAEATTELRVDERWRSGNRSLDRQRGIIPATVVGTQVLCRKAATPPAEAVDDNGGILIGRRDDRRFGERLRTERAALAAATALAVGTRKADVLDFEPLALADTVRRLATGVAINRAAFAANIADFAEAPDAPRPDTQRSATSRICDSRLLASPLYDIGVPVVFGDLTQTEAVAKALEQARLKHGPLDDVVVVHSGAIIEGRILLLARREIVAGNAGTGLLLRFVTADGDEIGRQPVLPSDMIAVTGLPARWTDAGGPWVDPIDHVVRHAANFQKQGYIGYLVTLPKLVKADRIEIGVLHSDSMEENRKREQRGRPYYVAAIEFTTLAEVAREQWDDRSTTRNRGVIESFLGPDSGDVALLVPNQMYRLRTTVAVTARDKAGTISDGGTQTADFWFRTDADSPESLEPWMLCTTPGANEAHVFGHENPSIVFATHDVDRLWAAYGKELRVRIKAASFAQVKVPGVTHPIALVRDTLGIQPALTSIGAAVMSPFEAVLSEKLAEFGPCIAVDEDRSRHSKITLPIPLDPYTDYVIDIEAVAIGAPATTVGQRVLRRQFSTGAYGTFENFAATFQGVLTEHRATAPSAMAGVAATPAFAARDPQGAEFDSALIAAGLEPMAVPRQPRLVVFWEQAGAALPQPVAVLIDAPEPMRRDRLLPLEVESADTPPTRRWMMKPRPWLTLATASGGSASVTRIIWAPGNQRALVMLGAGVRGQRLRLALVKKAFVDKFLDGPGASDNGFVIVDEILGHAPWEEL